MKVLIINGSPHAQGNTAIAINEMVKIFDAAEIETNIIQVGNKVIRGCVACGKCQQTGHCIFNDIVNETAPLFEQADGMVIATPVYYAAANGTLISFLDRLFFSTKFDKTMKVGASVAICRRAGSITTFDELNKFFTISNMPIASSQYWNAVFGLVPGDAEKDGEGLQTMRTLAKNMVFLMKSIALGKEQFGLPEKEDWIATHFIR